jgi:DNA-binding response OmpR family regulator
MARILLAEDDPKLAELVKDWLATEKYLVDHTDDGGAALNLIRTKNYDVVILDWEMPTMTGVEICKQLRAEERTMPVLLLTGKSTIADKEEGFDVGADDYLTKPFHLKELSSRLRALLRRPGNIVPSVLQIGALIIDVTAGTVTKCGARVELFPKELALLEFLLRHPNQIFTLESLQEHVWSSESESSPDTVRQYVATLRKKLSVDGAPDLIRTVHRKGYMLELPMDR